MYSVKIRDHIMIAHSLPNEVFGPAQSMHGATYVVDAEFFSKDLNEHNVVVDIALASNILKLVLVPLAYQNLDEVPEFKGHLTTTEFLANYIHRQMALALAGQFTGDLKITLGESHIAWASFEDRV